MDTLIKILFVIVFPAFAIYFFIKYSKLKKKIKKLNKEKSREITNLETQNSELKQININISNQLNELSKYESIVDAEDQAKKNNR